VSRVPPSYPRRQQLRRYRTAAWRALEAVLAAIAAAAALLSGLVAAAGLLTAVALVAAFASRRQVRLAARSRLGADCENEVRRALQSMRADGWSVRNSVPQRLGDLDHVARSPLGLGFVIETKAHGYRSAHVHRTAAAAAQLARRRRRYPHGVKPVLCLARARGVHRGAGDVEIVSLDRLASVLRAHDAAGRADS
jgi:hypothetical protein